MEPYTEAELLAESAARLLELEASGRLGAKEPRVCHHFFPLVGAKPDAYLPLLPKLIAGIDPSGSIDVIGDPVGLEVWDLVEPDALRLEQRMVAFHAAATACSAVYGGWSYEPKANGN